MLIANIKTYTLGLTINANFDYHDSITIAETTITILSLSWHTIMIISRYYQVFPTMILNMLRVERMSSEQISW